MAGIGGDSGGANMYGIDGGVIVVAVVVRAFVSYNSCRTAIVKLVVVVVQVVHKRRARTRNITTTTNTNTTNTTKHTNRSYL